MGARVAVQALAGRMGSRGGGERRRSDRVCRGMKRFTPTGGRSSHPVLLFPSDRDSVIASFPLRHGQRPGTNRCLVWHRAASKPELDTILQPMTERELIRLLGPPDEVTVLDRAARPPST
jgi:hypothetical protein